MRAAAAVAVAVLIGACARGGKLSVTMVGVDTVRVSVVARAGRCPTGPGWLVEALDTAMSLLVWLPADTPAEQRVQRSEGFDRPQAVLQRASRRAIMSTVPSPSGASPSSAGRAVAASPTAARIRREQKTS